MSEHSLKWEDIPAHSFDENNEAHTQALQERCQQAGRMVCLSDTHPLDEGQLEQRASAFAVNMLVLEKQFSEREGFFTGNASGWRWLHTMEKWWREGYTQARLERKGDQ